MCKEMTKPRACYGKNEATDFRDYGGDANITHRDRQEAECACKYVGNADSVREGSERAVPALPFAMAK